MVESIEKFGKYTLLERVAVGGMAEIYRAKTVGLGGFEKLLAIKRLHPQYGREKDIAQMLVDEARIAVHLTHPNIAQIFDLGCIDGQYFIAMEFIDGVDLHQISRAVRRHDLEIPVAALVFIMAEALGGLHYAHSRSDAEGRPLEIVHRDVSPQNIMISREGEVKLVDFGIAKAQLNDENSSQHGIIKGKFYYMSPEQAYGHHIDVRTDIFAAGMVLYELLAGQNPYEGIEEAQLLKAVRQADFAPMFAMRPDLDAQLAEIITRATRRDAQHRFESALEMQSALVAYLDRQAEPYRRTELAQYVRDLVGEQRGQDANSTMSRVDYEANEASMIFAPGSSVVEEVERMEQADASNPFREEEPTRVWTTDGEKPANHIRGQAGRADAPSAGAPSHRNPRAASAPVAPPDPTGEHQRFGPESNRATSESTLPLAERLVPAGLRRPAVIIGVLVAAVLLFVTVIVFSGDSNSVPEGIAAAEKIAPLNFPKPVAKTMDVRMISQPAGARVEVDGAPAGVTPFTLNDVAMNKMIEIEVFAQGYESAERTVQVKAESDIVEFELQPVGGVLKVTTYPTNAQVQVDGKMRGRSPIDVPGLSREDTHEVVATLEDGREVKKDVNWGNTSARVKQISLKFEPDDSDSKAAAKPKAKATRNSRPRRRRTRRSRSSSSGSSSNSQPINLFGGASKSKNKSKSKPKKKSEPEVLDIWGD